jgi:hypothetical protein
MSSSVLHLGGQTRLDAPSVLGLGLALVVVAVAVFVFSERLGFLGWSAPVSTRTFADYRAVVVTLKRSSENVGQTTIGSGLHKTSSRMKTSYSYALGLHGPLGDLDLPLEA